MRAHMLPQHPTPEQSLLLRGHTHFTSTHASRKPNTALMAAAARAQEKDTK